MAPAPGMNLHQVFLNDPAGLRIELSFYPAEYDQSPFFFNLLSKRNL